MENCVFCKIIAKEIPGYVVGESGEALAFLDITPLAPGHTLVVPKTHVTSLSELSEKETGPLFLLVRSVAARLVERLGAQGLTIGINQGEAAHPGIEHMHVHIIPRFIGDNGGSLHTIVRNPPKESLDAVLQRLKD